MRMYYVYTHTYRQLLSIWHLGKNLTGIYPVSCEAGGYITIAVMFTA